MSQGQDQDYFSEKILSSEKAFAFVPQSTPFQLTQLMSFKVLDEHSDGRTLNYYVNDQNNIMNNRYHMNPR